MLTQAQKNRVLDFVQMANNSFRNMTEKWSTEEKIFFLVAMRYTCQGVERVFREGFAKENPGVTPDEPIDPNQSLPQEKP